MGIERSDWWVSRSSVMGKSHQGSNTPCQDSSADSVVGSWFLGAVSDGAGSAKLSHYGSKIISGEVVKYLAEQLDGLSLQTKESEIGLLVAKAVGRAREKIKLGLKEGESDKDFKATLVGAIVSQKGGWLFHIGDGMGLAAQSALETDKKQRTRIGYWSNYTTTQPENGEYANETYFATEPNALAHLRITSIKHPVDTLLLCSDGPMPFIWQNGEPNRSFTDVVLRHLYRMKMAEMRNSYLEKVLSDQEMDQFTDDDKTILTAQNSQYATYDLLDEQQQVESSSQSQGSEAGGQAQKSKSEHAGSGRRCLFYGITGMLLGALLTAGFAYHNHWIPQESVPMSKVDYACRYSCKDHSRPPYKDYSSCGFLDCCHDNFSPPQLYFDQCSLLLEHDWASERNL